MSNNKQKLELTWIGKNEHKRLEPRILLEDSEKSYHAKHRMTAKDLFDNTLIFGDNLLALRALEQQYAGQIKCIYIDPPFNTGQAFPQYEDGIEHSLWLSLMRDRLEILKRLLSPTGTIWVHLDDNEVHYLKVMMDEIFGRQNYVAEVVWRAGDSSNNDSKQFSIDHNTILIYSGEPGWKANALPRTEESNAHYSNIDNDPRGPWFAGNLTSPNPRPNLRFDVVSPQGHIIKPPANGWRWSKENMDEKIASGEIIFSADGKRITRKTYLADQKGLSPSTLWADIEETGHNRQAKYELKKLFPDIATAELFKTPKPERLIKKILMIATEEGDLVLDSFGGSGTTGAVAHKMNRRWIMVELGSHCDTVIAPRLQKVIDGTDKGGISEEVNWQGGGGFRYFHLAPSFLEKDKWDNWVINKHYNANMLAAAMCKIMGFKHSPSEETYWIHGHSTENDFIFVTTQTLDQAQIAAISDEVGEDRTLLICCGAYKARADDFLNLTIRKIPQAVLSKCEWGKDNYSLNITELPAQESDEPVEEKKSSKRKATVSMPLFQESEVSNG